MSHHRFDTVGFWVSDAEIMENDESHVRVVWENSEKFGFTREHVKEIYEDFGETPGSEGRAREVIIREAAKHGWIRVRHYVNRGSDYWSIQADDAELRRVVIEQFVRYALGRGIMAANAELRIASFTSQTMTTYNYTDGGAQAYLAERNSNV